MVEESCYRPEGRRFRVRIRSLNFFPNLTNPSGSAIYGYNVATILYRKHKSHFTIIVTKIFRLQEYLTQGIIYLLDYQEEEKNNFRARSSRPPLWFSGQSSWLRNGDVLCFL
jgi:hypothetical protein